MSIIGSDSGDVCDTLLSTIHSFTRALSTFAQDADGALQAAPDGSVLLLHCHDIHDTVRPSAFIDELVDTFNRHRSASQSTSHSHSADAIARTITILVPPFGYTTAAATHRSRYGAHVNVRPLAFAWDDLSPGQLMQLLGLGPLPLVGKNVPHVSGVLSPAERVKACIASFVWGHCGGDFARWPSFGAFLDRLVNIDADGRSRGRGTEDEKYGNGFLMFVDATPMCRFIAEVREHLALYSSHSTVAYHRPSVSVCARPGELIIVGLADPAWELMPAAADHIQAVSSLVPEKFNGASDSDSQTPKLVVINGLSELLPTSSDSSSNSFHRTLSSRLWRLNEPESTTSYAIGVRLPGSAPADLLSQSAIRVIHRLDSPSAFDAVRSALHAPASSFGRFARLRRGQALISSPRSINNIAGHEDAALLDVHLHAPHREDSAEGTGPDATSEVDGAEAPESVELAVGVANQSRTKPLDIKGCEVPNCPRDYVYRGKAHTCFNYMRKGKQGTTKCGFNHITLTQCLLDAAKAIKITDPVPLVKESVKSLDSLLPMLASDPEGWRRVQAALSAILIDFKSRSFDNAPIPPSQADGKAPRKFRKEILAQWVIDAVGASKIDEIARTNLRKAKL